jgi:hypothetical protein
MDRKRILHNLSSYLLSLIAELATVALLIRPFARYAPLMVGGFFIFAGVLALANVKSYTLQPFWTWGGKDVVRKQRVNPETCISIIVAGLTILVVGLLI